MCDRQSEVPQWLAMAGNGGVPGPPRSLIAQSMSWHGPKHGRRGDRPQQPAMQTFVSKLDERSSGSLHDVFLQLDVDRSGFISRDEIMNQCTLLGLEQQPVMRALDMTGPNNKLSYIEFLDVLRSTEYPHLQ